MTIPYLDNAATTPADPRVIDKMLTMLGPDTTFGNPSSGTHQYGFMAQEAVTQARGHVADLLHADAREIVFTSGATEAINLAIKGVAEQCPGGHIVTSAIEHPAVLDTCEVLAGRGHEITYVEPRADGTVPAEAVGEAIRSDTCLVSVMHANNETGVINDIAGIARNCRSRDVIFHTDAVQSFGKLALDMRETPADLVSVSAHKMYGPKGIGALYVRRRPGLRVSAQIHGGDQEHGMRSGTLAGHQIAGFGEACRIARTDMEADNARIGALRDQLEQGLSAIDGLHVNGTAAKLPGHLNVSVNGIKGELLFTALAQQLALSNGSACTSAKMTPSHVLKAMGLPDELVGTAVRFSLGRFTSGDDINEAISRFTTVVHRLQGTK